MKSKGRKTDKPPSREEGGGAQEEGNSKGRAGQRFGIEGTVRTDQPGQGGDWSC